MLISIPHMTDSPNLQTVRALYGAFARRDQDAIRAIFATDIEWNQMDGFPRGGRHVGADEIFRNVFQGFREEWVDWQAVVTDYADAGERIIAFGHYAGTFQQTGRPVRAEFAHVYTLREGRITRFVQYTDTRRVAEAMGLA